MKVLLFIAALVSLSGVSAHAYPASINISSVSVVATGATLTLPATNLNGQSSYSTGWYNHITHITANMLVTGGTPVAGLTADCTTTNLNNLALKFVVGNSTKTVVSYDRDYSNPMVASSTNTVTIVCPATGGVIWDLNVNYFQAP